MISFFLNQSQGLTTQKRKIIEKKLIARRKYNPFHLDCEYTKKKLCHCKRNPICFMSQGQKAHLWTSSYMKPHEFFTQSAQFSRQKCSSQQSKSANRSRDNHSKDREQEDNQKLEAQAKRQFDLCVEKIRALSRDEVAKFVQEHSKKYRRVVVDSADNHMNTSF